MINEFFKNILSQENLKCSFGFKYIQSANIPFLPKLTKKAINEKFVPLGVRGIVFQTLVVSWFKTELILLFLTLFSVKILHFIFLQLYST